MEFIICLIIFFMITMIIIALQQTISRQDIYQARLLDLQEKKSSAEGRNFDRLVLLKNLSRSVSSVFAARSFTENVQVQLLRAGIPLKGEEYIAMWMSILVVLPAAMYLISHNPWVLILGLLLGALLPKIYLNYKKDQRLLTLNQQLGDALVIMANALRAGFGFQQAMDTVQRELPGPISEEFRWTIREMNLGFSHEEALLNLGKRVGSEDLDMIVTGIIIQRQVGGNLAEILDNISGTIRERARIKKEIKVLTAQGRLSGLIIGLLPLVLIAVMLLINPAYFNVMIKDMRGISMLITAVFLEIIGFLMINKIIDIDW